MEQVEHHQKQELHQKKLWFLIDVLLPFYIIHKLSFYEKLKNENI
jgi:hypothetical protein